MSDERVRLTIENRVADVKMTRADKLNALDLEMFSALSEVGEQLKRDKSIRAVVLSGEGKAFCSGLDIMSILSSGGFDVFSGRQLGDSNLVQHVATVWRDIPVPVIAALHGVVYGGGFQISLGADMRFVAPNARLSIMEIKWGIVPDMAGNYFMPELARTDVIRELTYTGRIFSGNEAYEYGFATRVCDDPYVEAWKVANEIVNKNPDAIRAAKRLANKSLRETRADLLAAETEEQIKLIGSANQTEAVLANFEKRDPIFSDPI